LQDRFAESRNLEDRRYNEYIHEMSSGAKPPTTSLEDDAFSALLRTADYAQARAAEVLKAYDLTPTQYNALRILRGAAPHGLACHEIAARMLTHDPDITRLVARLERRGLAQRRRGERDRRTMSVRITEAGLRLLGRLDTPVHHFLKVLMGSLGEQRLRILLRLLVSVRGGE
jgi:DNA-binding MarR family transcriptional regulator